MEKVYMEVPKRNTKTWRTEDISPYDFKDDISYDRNTNQENTHFEERALQRNRMQESNLKNRMQDHFDNEEDEYDMDAIMEDMNRIDDELENECYHEADMYENGNIDWRWNEDVSQSTNKNMTIDRKTIVEEENPKRTTTTWMRVKRQY